MVTCNDSYILDHNLEKVKRRIFGLWITLPRAIFELRYTWTGGEVNAARKVTMTLPDFEGARQYALERLERELPENLHYHSLEHTRDDVAPAVERLAEVEGIEGEALLLLRTAAYFHDIGFIVQYNDHESASVQIAREALPHFGYTHGQIEAISHMIMATKLPQSPGNQLEQILADGDLDNLGRDDFETRSEVLRAELETLGITSSDEEWYQRQLDFIQTHRYFTSAARKLRDAKKAQNIQELIEHHNQHE
jgi:uncharacterized protein